MQHNIVWKCIPCVLQQQLSPCTNLTYDQAIPPTLSTPDNNNIPVHLDDYLRLLAGKLQNCSANDIRVGHLNVKSLRNKVDEVKCLQLLCKFDVIAITESHLDNSISDSEIIIDRMKILRLDRIGRKGGGCVLYYTDHLKATQRKDLYSPEIEALWLHVRFPATSLICGDV